MTIAEAVRSVRKRLGKKQIEFAKMLGCQQNTISRYEIGKLAPGPVVLMRLLDIPDIRPAERQAFSVELRSQFDRGLLGGGGTFEQIVGGFRPFLDRIKKAGSLMELLPERKRNDDGFRRFTVAVAEVLDLSETVDASVADILILWVKFGGEQSSSTYFRDALGFLRARLTVSV